MSKPGGQSSSSDYWSARDDDNQPANAEHNPHTRVIGGTFEFALILPNAANPQLQTPVTPRHNRRIYVCSMPASILLRHSHPSPTIRSSRSKTR